MDVVTAATLLFSLAGVASLVKKFVDYAGWISTKNWNAILTTTIALGAGVGLSLLFWATDFAKTTSFSVGDTPVVFSTFNAWTVAYIGLAIGAIVAWGVDVTSTAAAKLLGSK